MLGWLLRILLLVLIIRALWRLIAGVWQGAAGDPSRAVRAGRDPVALIKDPVCGTYIVRAKALSAKAGEDTHYFCSERCRDEFVKTRAGRRTA